MSGTLASLIRQHAMNPKVLYQVPETERESAPGRYDQTGSQKSPALDRRVEEEAAKKKGEDMGLDPGELEDIGGFDDLQDLVDDRSTDPGRDPDEPSDPPAPLDPNLPTPQPPTDPNPPVTPPDEIPGLRVVILHDGSISYSSDGGVDWRQFDAPGDPIGFSITSQGFFVATDDAIHYSPNLYSGWTELTAPNEYVQIAGFAGGDFDGGWSSWTKISGYDPWTGVVDHIAPPSGSGSYLGRDWIIFSNGEFEIGQLVNLTTAELSALADGVLSLSADVYSEGGTAELRIEKYRSSTLLVGVADRFDGQVVDSDPLDWTMIETIGTPGYSGTRTARLQFDHAITWNQNFQSKSLTDPTNIIAWTSFRFAIRLGPDSSYPVYTHAAITQSNVQANSANIRSGRFRKSFVLTLTSSTGPGSIKLHIPAGWLFPIDGYGTWTGASSSGIAYLYAPYGSDWQILAQASGGSSEWDRIAAVAETIPSFYSQLRCVIKGTGSPADVYIDNARLEIVKPSGLMEVTAIEGNRAVIDGYMYSLSPTGLSRGGGLLLPATGLAEDGTYWTGSEIVFPGASAPVSPQAGSIVQYIGDSTIVTGAGSIAKRSGNGWDTLSAVPAGSRVFRAMNGYLAIAQDGTTKASRSLTGPWTAAPAMTGSYSGTRGMISLGGRLFGYIEGMSIIWWLNGNVWRAAGAAPAGILDISGR